MNDNHTNEGLLKAWADEFESRGGMDRNRATTTASLAFSALDEYSGGNWVIGGPQELEAVAFDDGISEGVSRLTMTMHITTSLTGEDTYRYRGHEVAVRVGHEFTTVIVLDAPRAALIETRSMSFRAALGAMRDLDQLIDYLREAKN